MPADADVFEAADLMLSSRVSAMPVVGKDGKMEGIVSEADLVAIFGQAHGSGLHRLARSPVLCASAPPPPPGKVVSIALVATALPVISTTSAFRTLPTADMRSMSL